MADQIKASPLAEELFKERSTFRSYGALRSGVVDFLHHVLTLFFPQNSDRVFASAEEIELELRHMRSALPQLIDAFGEFGTSSSDQIAEDFFAQLPGLRTQMLSDAHKLFENDPAARSVDEVMICYPGYFALFVYRIAHFLHAQQVKTIARILSEYARQATGIEIHPGAALGNGVMIDHGSGIVIGETAVIGNDVKIYQGVTIGARAAARNTAGKRHPTIEDGVVLYPNAVVMGANTVVKKGTVVEANSVVGS